MSDVVLVGPIWTRAETAEYLDTRVAEVRARNDTLGIEGHWLEETYPALQFADHEVRFEVALVVEFLREQLRGQVIADRLTRPNAALGAPTPMQWFGSGSEVNMALSVAQADTEAATDRARRPGRSAAVAS